MLALRASSNDVQFQVTRGVTRPVWEADARGLALYDTARELARGLGYTTVRKARVAGRTGILPARWGLRRSMGLGVAGAGAHTLDEHIQVSSLAYRGKLMAGLLMTLD